MKHRTSFFNLYKVIFRHQNQIEIYSVDFLLREENQRILRKPLKQGCISTKGLSRNNLWINERFIPKAQSHLEYSYHSKNLFQQGKLMKTIKNIVSFPSRTIHHNISNIQCLFLGFPVSGSDYLLAQLPSYLMILEVQY